MMEDPMHPYQLIILALIIAKEIIEWALILLDSNLWQLVELLARLP
ncbi:MAG: hypothetical protein HQL41_09620 [Alphaproteobacteria bacterium]|nr:hypothetical protein [Alphaproteobacteria bacterium]